MTTLGDVIVEFIERPPAGAEVTILTLTERNGFVRQADRFKKRLATDNTSNYKVVRRNDIAFNPYLLWAGAVAQNTIIEKGIISPLYPTFRVREGHDPRFVARLLLTPQMIEAYDGIAYGSVPRRRRSSVGDFLALQLPELPSLPEQRHIAAILDQADELRAKRRKVLTHLNTLTQSIFFKMFGDPDKAAEEVPFGAVAGLVGGRSLVAEDSAAVSDYRVLKISAVTSGKFKPWESKPLPQGYVPPTAHLVRAGDLLMSRANTAELVGAVAQVDSPPLNLVLPDKIWRFEWRTAAEPAFWHALLSTPAIRRRISALASGTGGSMKNIAKAKLDVMLVPRIELHRQREFASRSHQLALTRGSVTAAVAASDELFTSLQSRAFDGRL